jgi:hypothetical protein
MYFLAFAQSLAHVLISFSLDDNSLSVLAMLGGIIGGWALTSLHQQMKARKVKVPRKPPDLPRKGP